MNGLSRSKRSQIQPYATALGEWLDTYKWHYWATFTYRPHSSESNYSPLQTTLGFKSPSEKTSPSSVLAPSTATWRRGLSKWARRTNPDLMFWGTESGPKTGRVHAHALLHFPQERNPAELWALAFQMFGRSHIDRFDPELGAVGYVTKYVTKELADFDLWTHGNYT